MMQLPASMWQAWTLQGEVGRDHLISKLPTAILQLGYWVFFLGTQVAGLGDLHSSGCGRGELLKGGCAGLGIHSNQEEANPHTGCIPHENYKNKGLLFIHYPAARAR
jgi:hypothetical protein